MAGYFHVRVDLPWFSRHLLSRAAGAAVTIAAGSAAYQAVAEARDRRRFPAPGRLVDIGNRRMHLMEAGDGSPAVVIVPALGEGVLGWVPVWQALAGSMRAVVYDRAGIGWSDPPGIGRRSFDDMADELHRALAMAGIAPPYLVTGHSMGGIIARRLAARYPGDVSGMVLVDSSHEDQARRLGPGWRRATLRQQLRDVAFPLGLRRLVATADPRNRLDAELARKIPAEYVPAARATALSSRVRRTDLREMLMMIRSRGQPPELGSLPLTVITATEKMDPRWDAPWAQMQAELAATSTNSRQVTADTGHHVHRDDPALVVKAVCDLLAVIS